jgi:hypothetical protein
MQTQSVRWRQCIETQGSTERIRGRGRKIKGSATTSRNAERRWLVKRMSCKGGAMRGNATTSRCIERQQRVEMMSGAVQREVTGQPARENERRMGVGGGGSTSRGSNLPRGRAAEVGQQERSLQSASILRGGCMSKRWVVKAVQQEATRQPAGANKRQMGGGRRRWRIERQGRTKRMSGRGNKTTSQTRGT